MWFKKKKKEPIYDDISELFDELYEKVVIISKATQELDSKLTNEYTGRALALQLVFYIGKPGNYKYFYDKLSLDNLVDVYPELNYNEFPAGFPVKDAVHSFIIGKYKFGKQVVNNNIDKVYTEFKKLEERFPTALKALFKLN